MTRSENIPSALETLLLRLGLLALTVGIWRSAIALWGNGDYIRQPLSVILALMLYVVAFGIIVLAVLRHVPRRAIWAFPVGIALIIAATVQYEIVTKIQSGQFVNSDVFALTDYGANLTRMGQNPYAYDYHDYQYIYRMTKTFSTPLLNGNYISQSIDYPALSLLIPIPLLALHIPTQWVYPIFLILTLGAIFISAPRIVRPIILLPLLVDPAYIFLAFSGVSDIVWTFFACMTVILWRKRWQSAIWFGLACATKQQPWLFAPFLLIRLWHESEGMTTRERWLELAKYTAISAGVFLVINGPFILSSPAAWIGGVLVPFVASMITLGQGVTSLTLQGMVNIPKLANTAYVGIIMVVGLFIYWRHFWKLRPVMWIIPSIAFWFGQRSLASYWYFNMIPLLIDVVQTTLDDPFEAIQTRVFPLKPTILVTGVGAGLILASLAWFVALPPSVLVSVQRPITVQGVFVNDLTVQVTNMSHEPMNPRFSVQSWTEQPQFWRVETGPSALEPGESAYYRIRAGSDQSAFNYGFGAQVIAADDNDYSLRGSDVLKGDVEQNFIDGVPNGNFEYWDTTADTPLSWGLITSGARTPDSLDLVDNPALKYVARLSLNDATGSEYTSAMLDTWLNLPTVPIELWVNPPSGSNQPDDLNLIYGVEIRSTFNDQAVWVLFGDKAAQGEAKPGLPYVIIPVPSGQWSKQSLNVRQILADAHIDIAPPQWVSFHTEIDYPKQMFNFRLLYAARNQKAGLMEADFGPIHAAQLQAEPVDVIRQSLDHPDYALVAHGDFVRRNYGFEEAQQYYQGALRLNPTSAGAHYGLAEIALHEGQWADAASGFQTALDAGLAPRALAQSGLAWADYQQGNLASAQTQIEDAVRSLEQTPFFYDSTSSATTYARLGWVAYRQQRYALAQRAYQRALELDSSNADANFGQGLIALKSQDDYSAVQLLRTAIRLGFDDPANMLAAEIVSLQRCDDVAFYSQALNLALPAKTCQTAS